MKSVNTIFPRVCVCLKNPDTKLIIHYTYEATMINIQLSAWLFGYISTSKSSSNHKWKPGSCTSLNEVVQSSCNDWDNEDSFRSVTIAAATLRKSEDKQGWIKAICDSVILNYVSYASNAMNNEADVQPADLKWGLIDRRLIQQFPL